MSLVGNSPAPPWTLNTGRPQIESAAGKMMLAGVRVWSQGLHPEMTPGSIFAVGTALHCSHPHKVTSAIGHSILWGRMWGVWKWMCFNPDGGVSKSLSFWVGIGPQRGWATPGNSQDLLITLCSRITPRGTQGIMWGARIESGGSMSKSCALPVIYLCPWKSSSTEAPQAGLAYRWGD